MTNEEARRVVRLVRILKVIGLLEAAPRTLEELAGILGVTIRTIRRDLEAIHASGRSVVREGDYQGAVWRLAARAEQGGAHGTTPTEP